MTTQRTCGKCGAPVGPLIAENLCVNCLLDSAIESDAGPDVIGPADTANRASQGTGGQSETSPLGRFGDYELLEEIGRGGMGVVYRARHVSLDRIVAVKMLLAGPLAGKDFIQRLRTEAVAAASLQHPNIVAIHEVGFAGGQHFFAMDFVQGPTLAQLVAKGPLPGRQAVHYVKTIAEAIHFAHERNVLRRDLKPSNVLIESATHQPRLTDFGLAKRLEAETDLTLSGQVLGSPNFISPEQATGKRGAVGRRSDIYSLGAILYHLLTGRPPFQGETLTDVLHQVVHTDPLTPRLLMPGLPRDVETICLKCLEKEPSRRYQTAEQLAEELNRFLHDEPIHARPVTRTERTWRWCRRKPVVASLSAATATLLLAVAVGSPIALFRIKAARDAEARERLRAEGSLYAANMKHASQAVREGQMDRARELLIRHQPKSGVADLRGFEWRYLWRATEQGEVVRTLGGLPFRVGDFARLVRVGDTLYNLDYSRNELRAWSMTDWTVLPSQLPSHTGFDRWFWHPDQEIALAVDNTSRTLTLYQLPGFQKDQIIPLRGRATRSAISPDHRLPRRRQATRVGLGFIEEYSMGGAR
ncbi:MAG: serine/threonine protein kinase [Verrucomicrobiales bacterium]|nr:serine/threonine protein kinase [Verrucomicrobiales bacterium]